MLLTIIYLLFFDITNAYFYIIMSERISIVVPNGTIQKLKQQAYENGYTQSALGRKILLDGLKKSAQLFATVSGADFQFQLDRRK